MSQGAANPVVNRRSCTYTLLREESEALSDLAMNIALLISDNIKITAPHLRAASPAVTEVLYAGPEALTAYTAHWFAVFTTPRHEKRVAEHFGQRQIESFLPLYRVSHRWKNRCKVLLELPLFPSYIFAHIDRRERVRVLNVPGVLGIVGTTRELLPIPDACIESLRGGVGLNRIKPHPNVSAGDRVRVIEGPMAGIEGILLRTKTDLRVILRLDSIMQSVALEVSVEEIERVTPDAHRDD